MTRQPAAVAWLVLGGAVALSACGDSPKTASLAVELAPSVCGDPVPLDLPCVRLRVCPEGALDAGELDACFPLALPDGPHGADAARELTVAVGADGRVTFDAKLGGGAFDIDVVGYDADNAAVVAGRVRGATALDGARVVLRRFGEATCGTVDEALTRAFHAAVPAGPDRVLLLGGVQGSAVSKDREASFQSRVELVDISRGTTRVLDGPPLRRVLFTALPDGDGAGAALRVRLVGGYEPADADADDGALIVRPGALIADDPLQAPVRPGSAVVEALPVDLAVDLARGSYAVEAAGDCAAGACGWLGADLTEDGVRLVGGPPAGAPACWDDGTAEDCGPSSMVTLGAPPAWAPVGQSVSTGVARVGATVTDVSVASGGPAVLVAGGPIATTGDARDGAAAFLGAASGEGAVATVAPTAFHTATDLGAAGMGAGRVLLLGGLTVGCLSGCGTNSVVTGVYADAPARVLTVDATARTVLEAPVDGASGYAASVFHTATRVALPGDLSGVLVVGGTGGGTAYDYSARADVGWFAVTDVDVAGGGAEDRVPTTLGTARWGHAATLLPGGLVVVSGGFASASDGGRGANAALGTVEVLTLTAPPAPLAACGPDGGG